MIWLVLPTTALLTFLLLTISFPAAPPKRHHYYYCVEPRTGLAMHCMYRRNDPVSV
jgi:hypothetical protein